MGKIKAFAPHVKWTDAEIEILAEHYPSAALADLERMLPGRGRRMFQCKANALGIERAKTPKMTPDEVRKAKRESMARRRAADLEGARAYAREDHTKNRIARVAKMREYIQRRFFWARSMHLRGPGRATAKQLAALWKSQRGLCALTGIRLDREAQLDHRLPKARGGGDEIGNLQWVCEKANMAKRDLTDDEFVTLCGNVMAWIGRRIAIQDAA